MTFNDFIQYWPLTLFLIMIWLVPGYIHLKKILKKEKLVNEQAREEYPEWILKSDQTKKEIISKLSTTKVMPKIYFKKLVSRERGHNFLVNYISINLLILIFIWIFGFFVLFIATRFNFQLSFYVTSLVEGFLLIGEIIFSPISLPLSYYAPYQSDLGSY